jgi:uncharacterized protein (TIGR03435 family)
MKRLATVIAILLIAFVSLVASQTAPAVKRLEFEVAVLRPVTGEKEIEETLASYQAGFRAPGDFFGDTAELRCKGIDGGWSSQARNVMASAAPIPLGRCIGLMNAGSLIRAVREQDYPAAAGRHTSPQPIPQQYYQLTAKAENPRTATKAQLLEMLKNLTYDRFKLRAHTETKEEDGWAIRVAPGGLKIKETLLGEEKRLSDVGGGQGKRTTIQYFFDSMAAMNGLNHVGKMVNMTGLMGVYEFPQLNFTTVPPLPGAATGARGANGANIPLIEYDPPFEEQIEKLLGLRIKREKVPVQYMVIDHVELPGPN